SPGGHHPRPPNRDRAHRRRSRAPEPPVESSAAEAGRPRRIAGAAGRRRHGAVPDHTRRSDPTNGERPAGGQDHPARSPPERRQPHGRPPARGAPPPRADTPAGPPPPPPPRQRPPPPQAPLERIRFPRTPP